MRSKLLVGGLGAAVALLLATNPIVVQAAGVITSADIVNNTIKGKDVKDSSLTGKDVKDNSLAGGDINESSLGQVPSAMSADGLSVAPGGTIMSGVFSAAASNSAGEGDYLGFAINYPRPLASPVSNSNIIDTSKTPDAVHCPGPGQAARGYLCLYNVITNNVAAGYGYSSNSYVLVGGRSVGVVGYFPVTGDNPYAGGVWTVNAP